MSPQILSLGYAYVVTIPVRKSTLIFGLTMGFIAAGCRRLGSQRSMALSIFRLDDTVNGPENFIRIKRLRVADDAGWYLQKLDSNFEVAPEK